MFRRAVRYSRNYFGLFKRLKNITDKRIKPWIATAEVAIAIFSRQLANLGSLNNFAQQVSSPSVSTIARSADTMSLDDIRDVGLKVYKKARRSKMLTAHHGRWIGIIDGKETNRGRVHSKDGRGWEDTEEVANWMWVSFFTIIVPALSLSLYQPHYNS